MGVGKLKEPGRGESVGFNLLVFIASSAYGLTSEGYCHRRRMEVSWLDLQLLI